MAQELIPKPGQPLLSIDEVTRRLKATFKYVEIDGGRASQGIEESVQFMTKARAQGATGYSAEQIESAKRSIGHSVHVVVADDPSVCISFTLSPEDETVFIGFESDEHEEAATPLCERLAKALDYEMEIV
jgi:hypothetical protein